MALTSAQIISLTCQKAKLPGYTAQAGQQLNVILQELAMEHDLAVNLWTASLTVSASSAANFGMGPYALPANYLRMASRELTYTISSIPYQMMQIALAQMDVRISVQGAAQYPNQWASDVSANNATPQLYIYPPPNVVIPLQLRYYGLQPDIVTPETSAVVPWFPCQNYLLTRLLGELYAMNGKAEMASMYLGDGPVGAVGILRRYLGLQGDKEDIGSELVLDQRFFGPGGQSFPPSKLTGGI